ncbi:MAG: regulatory protein RecX [Proteobacteria bacterium]|nr:regulatory protein RecX [Pseudomonadota bacterium]
MGDEEELKRAKKSALRMLAFRARSKQEMREKLSQKGFSASVTKKVLAYLIEYGYVNDNLFAQQLALGLFENKNWGFIRIRNTLKNRGVLPELVDKTIFQLKKNHSEEETALRILKRRFSHINLQEASLKEKKRIIQFFQQRGFSWETITKVLMI